MLEYSPNYKIYDTVLRVDKRRQKFVKACSQARKFLLIAKEKDEILTIYWKYGTFSSTKLEAGKKREEFFIINYGAFF